MFKNIRKKIISNVLNTDPGLEKSSSLSDYVVLITGGNGGLGRGITKTLVSEGAKVCVISRSKLEDKSFHFFQADIRSETQLKKAVNQIVSKFGKVDVLINNAGIYLGKSFEECTEKDYENVLDTNLKGIFLATKAVLPVMKKQKKGFIINIGSKVSHNTNVSPNQVLYATSKYAVEGLSFALNKELKGFGIRVSCIMPGTINTYPTLKAQDLLSPYEVGNLVSMMVKFKNIDFESMVFKSVNQNI